MFRSSCNSLANLSLDYALKTGFSVWLLGHFVPNFGQIPAGCIRWQTIPNTTHIQIEPLYKQLLVSSFLFLAPIIE